MLVPANTPTAEGTALRRSPTARSLLARAARRCGPSAPQEFAHRLRRGGGDRPIPVPPNASTCPARRWRSPSTASHR